MRGYTLEEKRKAVAIAELFEEYEKDPVAFLQKYPDQELIESFQKMRENIDATTAFVNRNI